MRSLKCINFDKNSKKFTVLGIDKKLLGKSAREINKFPHNSLYIDGELWGNLSIEKAASNL